MVAIQYCTVTVSIPDEFTPPAQAGNLGPEEVRRIAKAPRGIGLACDERSGLDRLTDSFGRPHEVVDLRESANRVGKRRPFLPIISHLSWVSGPWCPVRFLL